MTQAREARIRDLTDAIGNRELSWFGIRGHDAAPLLRIPQFRSSFSVTAPLEASSLDREASLEQLTSRRVDLDAYDIDIDQTDGPAELRQTMLRALNRPSLLLNYRPAHFTSDLGFALSGDLLVLGLFKDRHRPYEYKPWVETQLRRQGITTIDWRYIADEHRSSLRAALRTQPLILRVSRASGGVGIVLAREQDDLDAAWPRGDDHLVAVAPYYDSGIPLNASGCVFDSGDVVLHPASVQLIGLPGVTTRPFGYCGNDFGAFAALDVDVQESFDRMCRQVGAWLARDGYRGAFGVDGLLVDGRILFGEINARLQGSTALSSSLTTQVGEPDIVLDHLAALLGLEPSTSLSLHQWARLLPPAAHIVLHNVGSDAMPPIRPGQLRDAGLGDVEAQLLAEKHCQVEPGAVLTRLVFPRSVTADGFALAESPSSLVAEVRALASGTESEEGMPA